MDKELARTLTDLHVAVRYLQRPCPHCGKLIGKEDQPVLIFSAGGKYLQEYGVAAHPQCFYVHEATDEWRAKHPEFEPK